MLNKLPIHPTSHLISQVDHLRIHVYLNNNDCGAAAALQAQVILQSAIRENGRANAIFATGNSQLAFLQTLRTMPIPWNKVNIFHMDEYIGLPPGHTASFPHFLQQHLIRFIQPAQFFAIDSSSDHISESCLNYARLLGENPADLCAMGIGENGHIAFNDPPEADFKDPHSVKVVTLAERSRQQQVGEGHFADLSQVPKQAITLTIPTLLSAKNLLCIVPEQRKANAVKQALFGPIQANCPASILRLQNHCVLFLDLDSSSEVLHELESRP